MSYGTASYILRPNFYHYQCVPLKYFFVIILGMSEWLYNYAL